MMRVQTLMQWRKQRLLTIRALASVADVSTRTIYRIEHGLQAPYPGTIKKVAAALMVEPAQVREFRAVMGLPEGDGE